MHLSKTLLSVVTATLVSGGVFVANAVVEAPQNAQLEIPLAFPSFDPQQNGTSRLAEAASAIEDAVSTRLGGEWQVPMMNTYSRTPRYVLGSGYELNQDVSTDAAAELAARGIVATNPEVFGSPDNDLELWDVRRGAGKVAVHFQQRYEGLEVWEARAHVTMTEGARVFALKSNIFSDIDVDPTPGISEMRAIEIAKAGVPFDGATDSIDGDVELIVLPVGVTPIDVEHRLVYRIRVSTQDPLGIWVSHVDAHSGDIVWRYNDIHFLDVSGSAQSDVQPQTYCLGSEVQASPYLDITITGIGEVTTDSDGNWNAGDGGTGTYNVVADIEGPYCDINNVGGVEGTFSGSVTAGTPLLVEYDNTNSQADERTVFDSVNDVHDFIEIFDPGYFYSNTVITANVSLNSTCNAFWNGTINFYNTGGGCGNTGEIAGVVHHEFGHGIQNDLIGSQGNEGLGEGNSDIIANLITQDPIIGRGFFIGDCSDGTGIRDSDNLRQYPADLTGQVHNDGMIIAGFNWHVMENMQALYGTDPGTIETATLWHFGRKLETPTIQPDQVISYFIVDDDDGDLGNGTPNYDAICDAATLHDFEEYCPEIIVGVFITHQNLNCTTDGSNLEITATATSTEAPIDASTVQLHYTKNGSGEVSITMTPTGGLDEYSATLPVSESPSEFTYRITAADISGNSASNPRSGGSHEFDVATIVELMESDPGWTVNPDGTDNATTGIWTRVEPLGTGAQPDEDFTPIGELCWVTGNGAGGLGADDIDNGSTTLQTGSYNLSGAATATLRYRRWYSNDKGADPNNDTWVVQVRNNGGAWVDVERNQSNQNQWIKSDFDLVAEYGAGLGSIEVRFVGSDLNSGSIVECAIDDFKVLAGGEIVDVEIDDSPAGIPLAKYLGDARPNPFNPRTTISYGLDVAEKVTLSVYDVNGRLVRSLVDTNQAAGNYAVIWDGRDNAGRDVASGVYYSRLHAGSFAKSSKLNLLK